MRNYRAAQVTNSKLTEVDVRSMRLRHAQGKATVRSLAGEYGLAFESVRKILRRETWAQVSEEGPGAMAADWMPPAGAVEASLARLQGMLAAEGTPMPSLEDALKQVPAEPAPILEKLRSELAVHARLDRELNELAGHGNEAVIDSPNTATPTQSTDGDSK